MSDVETQNLIQEMAKAAFEYRPDGKPSLMKWSQASADVKRFHIENMNAAFAVVASHIEQARAKALEEAAGAVERKARGGLTGAYAIKTLLELADELRTLKDCPHD